MSYLVGRKMPPLPTRDCLRGEPDLSHPEEVRKGGREGGVEGERGNPEKDGHRRGEK